MSWCLHRDSPAPPLAGSFCAVPYLLVSCFPSHVTIDAGLQGADDSGYHKLRFVHPERSGDLRPDRRGLHQHLRCEIFSWLVDPFVRSLIGRSFVRSFVDWSINRLLVFLYSIILSDKVQRHSQPRAAITWNHKRVGHVLDCTRKSTGTHAERERHVCIRVHNLENLQNI